MPNQITERVSKLTGRKTWQVRVRIGAKPDGRPQEIVRSFRRRRDALAYRAQVLQERATGSVVVPSRMTLNAFLDRWLAAVGQRVRPQTVASYRDVLARYVRQDLGVRRLDQLTPLVIQRHIQVLTSRDSRRRVFDRDTGTSRTAEGLLSPRTIRYSMSILRGALRQAVKWRLLSHNPSTDVEVPRQQRQEMQAMGKEQAAAFLRALAGTRHEALFALALATGIRPGEYLALKWSDVDLERGVVVVQRTLVSAAAGWRFDEPKTSRSRRSIPLPVSLVGLLRKHRVAQLEQRMRVGGAWQENGLVFTNEIGQPLDRRNLVRRHLRPLLRKAGLPGAMRLYDLRHSAATLLLEAGVHAKVASERLGHSSIVITLDTYSHVLPDLQREASDKMEEMLFDARR